MIQEAIESESDRCPANLTLADVIVAKAKPPLLSSKFYRTHSGKIGRRTHSLATHKPADVHLTIPSLRVFESIQRFSLVCSPQGLHKIFPFFWS